ncbi:hypothetical protein [Sphingomonas sp.]|uniref:hypothetical protein n=1 Tax=Sphingomonas sp. TaxID=28214 RepID=UPI002FC70594
MRLILFLLLSLTASPALAGQRAVYAEPDGKTLTVEVADNGFARVRTGDPDQYGIWRDGQFYIVGREDGRVMVARIEDMAAAIDQVVPPIFKAMFEAVGTGPPASLRIEAKGKRRVAGHEGRVYAVYGIDKDKPKESADFVMSSEPALQPVGRAMEQFMIATIVPIGALIGDAAAEMVADTRAVFAKGAPLDLGGRFILVSFEPAEVTQEMVALPAKPQSVAEIVASLKVGTTEPQAEAAPAAE